ncbi:hypothetical protein LXL04_031325 [Taraxacum kok-saghyz]
MAEVRVVRERSSAVAETDDGCGWNRLPANAPPAPLFIAATHPSRCNLLLHSGLAASRPCWVNWVLRMGNLEGLGVYQTQGLKVKNQKIEKAGTFLLHYLIVTLRSQEKERRFLKNSSTGADLKRDDQGNQTGPDRLVPPGLFGIISARSEVEESSTCSHLHPSPVSPDREEPLRVRVSFVLREPIN